MNLQSGFAFDDPDSRSRSQTLDVVYARAQREEPFNSNLFAGFTSLRALTYTSSIPMILGLLRDFDFDDFECVFGHNGVLSRDAAAVLAFQQTVDECLSNGFVGVKGLSGERRQLIYDRAMANTARFYVVKDAVAHAKIYLLEGDEKRRVIVGSANLSETAFSGRQAETLIVFDQDEEAWEHYSRQYRDIRDIATSHLPLREEPIKAELIPLEETPALQESESRQEGIMLYVPTTREEEADYSVPHILHQVERIKPVYSKALADQKPDRNGNLRLDSRIVRQMTSIVTSRQSEEDTGPKTWLSFSNGRFNLSGSEFSLATDPAKVRDDVAALLEFFANYENGFVGDVPRLQRDYFTFVCWFYLSPLMCDLRSRALRQNIYSFDQPMFAVIYGPSSCGKSSLIETTMESMFGYPRIVETRYFTRSTLRGLQQAYQRFPVVFDDVTRDRFNRNAPEIIKDETIPYAEYPCFALSMNAEARNFPAEIVKRCLMIYTRTSLPGDNTTSRRSLQRSVASIRERLTTNLYRKYLRQVMDEISTLTSEDYEQLDVLQLSSASLCRIIRDNLPDGQGIPGWCEPMTLEQYQNRAFDRPRLVLDNLLHRDKYAGERRPALGSWTISGSSVVIAVEPMTSRQTQREIPDWILDDTASVSDQIVLKRDVLEHFLGRRVRPPRRWWFGR